MSPIPNSDAQPVSQNLQVVRETIESLAVAFILALLFKAFIAEAFVIPTGSMAPTLMGAHKDVECVECGFQYQCGASNEFSPVGERTSDSVVGTTCPLCRKQQPLDLAGNSNHVTFSGDRILVSKLAYVWNKPRRWDVIVFKFIEDARLNYIKRCIGRPNETIRIREGDIYVQSKETVEQGYEIARKPPHVVNAMLQPLSDTKFIPRSLVKAGVPGAWQPEQLGDKEGGWSVKESENLWVANAKNVPAGKTARLRYYHRVIDPVLWASIDSNRSLTVPIDPHSSRLVSDFTAYNASASMSKLDAIPSNFQERATEVIASQNRMGVSDRLRSSLPLENDGLHWTGDLAAEFEFSTERDTQSISLLLVEAGVEHECRVDLKTGKATASVIVDGQPLEAFGKKGSTLAKSTTANTSIRAGGKHRVRFANVDDCLFLWVDGKVTAWETPALVESESFAPLRKRAPKSLEGNPLDAAPIAFGVEGGSAEVSRARAFRDIYYIAHSLSSSLTDYPDTSLALRESATSESRAKYMQTMHGKDPNSYLSRSSPDALNRNSLLSDVNLYAASPMNQSRRIVDFSLKDQQYFPMGDNSGASSDARSWGEHHSPERLFIGRAVLVFWPHYWNSPIPFLPNVQRMGLIR